MDLLNLSRKPILAYPSMTASEAISRMVTNNVGAIVVADPARRVVGIFTERDVLCRITFKRVDPEMLPLTAVMTRHVQTVSPETSVEDALTRMIRGSFRHLPIVDTLERVIGIVSLRYLLMRRLGEDRLFRRLSEPDMASWASGPWSALHEPAIAE